MVFILLVLRPCVCVCVCVVAIESGIEGVDILVADVYDQDSLDAMCAQASVIINCVGPVSELCTSSSWLTQRRREAG